MGSQFKASALALLFSVVLPANGQCNYGQMLQPGQTVDVFSPNYAEQRSYPAGTQCNWQASSPVGTTIQVTCVDIQVPWSPNCSGDRLEISFTGNPSLADAQRFCTNAPFSYNTQSNQVRLRLTTTPYSLGGKVRCQLSVASNTKTPDAAQSSTSNNDSPFRFEAAGFSAAAVAQPLANNAQCGRRKLARIVGGTNTAVNEFPMMAALIKNGQRPVHCGATIISQWYLVTAAHCVDGLAASNIRVLVGDHDLGSGTDSKYARLYPVGGITVHQQYNAAQNLNDIALLRTAQAIEFNVAVGPVCLPANNDLLAGQNVEAVGWGTTSFGGPVSDVLQKVSVMVLTNAQCAQSYGSRIQASNLCTWTRGRDSCQHDSGGPLYTTVGGAVYLAGIISWGTTCADNYPSVASRATYFANWIRQYAR